MGNARCSIFNVRRSIEHSILPCYQQRAVRRQFSRFGSHISGLLAFYRISTYEATGIASYILAGIYFPGWIPQLCMDAAFLQRGAGTATGKHGALYNIGCIAIETAARLLFYSIWFKKNNGR